MASGVLTSNTVPVNWTIDRVEDSALRDSLYVQLQKAYKVTDELGYQQAASAMTTQLTVEVNALLKLFATSPWAAASNEDALNVSKSLLISGLTSGDLGPNMAAFYTTPVSTGVTDRTVKYSDLPPPEIDIGLDETVGPDEFLEANI